MAKVVPSQVVSLIDRFCQDDTGHAGLFGGLGGFGRNHQSC
jgi:hypothetical protein